jgi:hypothetical protein
MYTSFYKRFNLILLAALFAASFTGLRPGLAYAQAAPASQSSSLTVIDPAAGEPAAQSPALSPIPPANSDGPTLVSEDESGVVVELFTPEFSFETSTVDGVECQALKVEDYPDPEHPGWPRLPVSGTLVGIPASGEPVLTILEAEPVQLEGHFNLCPVPRPIFETDENGEISYLGEAVEQDPQAYSQNTYHPGLAAEMVDTAFIRSQRVAQIRFHPFQYNPALGSLRFIKRIVARLDFAPSAQMLRSPQPSIDEGVFEKILSANLANYTSAAAYRGQPGLPARFSELSATVWGTETYKLVVSQRGLYKVTYQDLQAAGANLAVLDPHTFQVFNQDEQIAIQVTGEADGAFDPGDQVLFYGEPADTKYTDDNVYWLTWGIANGMRMAEVSAAPGSASTPPSYSANLRIESNSMYLSSSLDSNGDNWYWSLINAQTAPASANYTFSLNRLDFAASSTARLRGMIKGYAATPYHHTRIYINNHLIDDTLWAATAELAIDVQIPMAHLVEGSNTVRVECPRDGGITVDRVLVNWFELDYWRTFYAEADQLEFNGLSSGSAKYQVLGYSTPAVSLFDVTDPGSPAVLAGQQVASAAEGYSLSFQTSNAGIRRYLALSPDRFLTPTSILSYENAGLKSASNAADYLLITHATFSPDLQPLADWRLDQGMRVKIVDVQSIYDEFSAGLMDPNAIRDFIAYAYQNWERPAPQYVLLVGDGHYDPRNYKSTNEPVFIPAYLLSVDYWLIETAVDNRYVTVSGSDNLPDLMIGRLPVKTRAEAAAMVSKIIAYEQTPSTSGWNDDLLFVTDNPDSAGNFYGYSDQTANNYVPTGYTSHKVYYGSTHTTVSSAQTAIRDGINQGRLMVNYVGHGSVLGWAGENLFNANSVPTLTNNGKYPLFTILACLTGYFHTPSPVGVDYSSLGEALVKPADRGAIASWASSGMGLASGQDYLNRGLYNAVLFEGHTRLGSAAMQAKLFLTSNSSAYPDLVDNYTLFGDPALKLKVLPADLSIEMTAQSPQTVYSGMPITYRLAYVNEGEALATHVRIDNPLPQQIVSPVIEAGGATVVQIENSRLSWEVTDLAPGEGGEIVISGIVNSPSSGQFSNQATIDTATEDANSANNTTNPLQTEIIKPTSITILNSTAVLNQGIVEVTWETNIELDLRGFNLYRSLDPDDFGDKLNVALIPSQNFGSLIGATYTFSDITVPTGSDVFYWIEIVELNSSTMFRGPSITASEASSNFLFLPVAVRLSN